MEGGLELIYNQAKDLGFHSVVAANMAAMQMWCDTWMHQQGVTLNKPHLLGFTKAVFAKHLAVHQAAGLVGSLELQAARDKGGRWENLNPLCRKAWRLLIEPVLSNTSPGVAHVYRCVRPRNLCAPPGVSLLWGHALAACS